MTALKYFDPVSGEWLPVTGGGTSGRTLKQQVFTSSGTFTLPATAQPMVWYDVIGGGGGGVLGSPTTPGGHATSVGSGGGAAYRSAAGATIPAAGDGFRGEVRIIYEDNEA